MNLTDYVLCCVIGCLGNHCCIWFEHFRGTFWGGPKIIFEHIYLNDYSEFDRKISYLMFLHGYLLACEISTVRTQTLKPVHTIELSAQLNVICVTLLSTKLTCVTNFCKIFFIRGVIPNICCA